MKKFYTFRRTLSAMFLLMMSSLTWAYDFEMDGIYYNINEDGESVSVTNYYGSNSYSGDVVIPSTVVWSYTTKTYRVTSIGDDAFFACFSLTSVEIPESVTSIGNYAFENCGALTSITIPEGVTSIGDYAFRSTTITSISLPESVTSIGNGAFQWCGSLASIIVAAGNSKYDSRNNCNAIIETESNTLIAGSNETIIPESVTGIGDYAFFGCSSLTSITIPENVKNIGYYAFGYCSSLTSIIVAAGNSKYDSRNNCNAIIETESNTLIAGSKKTIIPDDITSIESMAFLGSGITSIIIPESITNIKGGAFMNCRDLTSITIPEGITSIDAQTFYGCSSLTSITIPESVTSIGTYTFFDCGSLASITIPEGVTSIEAGAFSSCSSLASITIPEGVTNIEAETFEGCPSLVSVTIPENVTSIGDNAFWGCSSLTSITIPEGVTRIGHFTFAYCSSLTSIICHAENVPELGLYVFYDFPTSEATLYVLASALEDYKVAEQWQDFGTILPLENIPAGINNINVDDSNALYYTLDGIRVDNPTKKGIYIKNGKKVLVK